MNTSTPSTQPRGANGSSRQPQPEPAAALRRPTPKKPGTPVYECEPFDLDYFRHAPQRLVFERTLDAPAARVFEIFEDAASWPVWGGPGIQRVEWTSPRPFGVGTERTVFFIGGMEVYERFIAWEPARELAFCFVGATQRVWWSFGEHYLLTDLGSRCRWRWTVAYDPRRVFKSVHGLARPLLRFELGRIAEGLVRYVREHR